MSYEPAGKVAKLVEAMRAAPGKAIWTREEVARVMEVDRMGQIPVHLATAIGHGVIFANASRWQFSLQPFVEAVATGAATPQASDQVTGYLPPKMTPPRPGSDRMPSSFTAGRDVMPEPAGLQPIPPPNLPAVPVFLQRQPAPQPEPEVASSPPAPVEPEGQPAPFSFCRWHDGDIDIFGLLELADGSGHRITAAQWEMLKREFAWTRPA